MRLREGLQTQLQVVHALIMRETRTRFGAQQLGYIWALIEPLFWVVTFYALYTLLERSVPYGMDIVTFITTGVIPFLLFRQTMGSTTAAISANKALLYYPQIRPLDLIMARTALEITTLITVFTLIMAGHALYTGTLVIDKPLTVLIGLTLAGLLGAALGLFFSALGMYSKVVDRIVPMINRPLFWISGLFFTANQLPTRIREVLLWNPILHTVEMVRDGWFYTYEAHYLDISYVLYWIIGFAYIGLVLERMSRRRLELT
jgi:capsular polysaccharide transport system permease protein